MRRRQIFSGLNARDNRAPVPSGAGMGAATASQPDLPSPVSREEEEKTAQIWEPSFAGKVGDVHIWTPTTDVTAAVQVKKRGRPKGSKNKVAS
jgi:hypothetical protein